MPDTGSPSNTLLDDGALDSLADLERNKSDEVKRARSNTRIRIKAKVIVQPGNVSERSKFKAQGVTGDISSGGCQILFPIPLHVGDIFWLSFDKSKLAIAPLFGHCLRCSLIREDAYEAAFRFFEPIDISAATETGDTGALFG